MDFKPFPKIPRYSREMVITEKIDGTNASVWITQRLYDDFLDRDEFVIGETNDFFIRAGSRNRFITPDKDNFGFAKWVSEHAEELIEGLGEGTHYGEWWGKGIQRNYGLDEKRFSLFNVKRWFDPKMPRTIADKEYRTDERVPCPDCCSAVPVLGEYEFDTMQMRLVLERLRVDGSFAAPGFPNPEGIMIFHTAAQQYFKKTLEDDEAGKERSNLKVAAE